MHFLALFFQISAQEYARLMIYLLCRLEENDKLVLTPFEKNIDIWRQLWRVLERSDLVSFAALNCQALWLWLVALQIFL